MSTSSNHTKAFVQCCHGKHTVASSRTLIVRPHILLLTEQSNLYHSQNSEKWNVLPKTLKWSNITPEEMRKFFGIIILMEQLRNENTRDYWSTDPTISTPIFPHTMSRKTILNPFGRPGILVTTGTKHRIQGGSSKFGRYMNILYRNLGKCTYIPKQELSLDEAMILWRGRLKFRT